MTSALTADALAELKGHADLPDLPVRVPPELMRALLSELEQSRVERKEMMQVLTEVKEWIGNWDPPFTQDEEWPATSAKIDRVLSRARQRTQTGG